MRLLTTAVTVLSLGIIPALAQSATPQANPSGPYVGVGWGQMNLDLHNLSDVGTATSKIVKADDNAWKLFAGWRLNSYLAFEAAYIDFGQPGDRFDSSGSNGNYKVELNGFAPYIIGSIPLGNAELFAKAGSYFYDVNVLVDLDNPGPDIRSSHSRNDFLYGGGIGYTFMDHLHVRAEYEVVDLKNASNSQAIWLSGAWRF
ncbi:MAG: porin family protein [Steroidobacteraceae bacterium]